VAAGVVTATVLFSKDLDAISRRLAYASWIALIFSVMFGIAVLFNLSGNLNNAAEGKYRTPSVLANDIRIFSVGQIGMFVLGIILIFCFGYHAIQVPKGVEKTIAVNCVMPPFASAPISTIGDRGHPSAALPMVSGVDYAPIMRVVVLLVVGAALLVVGVRLKSFVPAFAGSAMLLMGLTPTVTNNFNIGEHFKIDVTSNPLKPRPGTVTGTHTFKLIGLIMNFAPGCADLEGTHCKFAQSLRFVDASKEPITRDKLFDAVCKEKEMVFIVGRTDRVRLGSNLRMQYESNVGLAQDRAESVKKVVSNFCADQRGIGSQEGQGLSFPPLVTQVGGPRNTSLIQSGKDQSPDALASGDDRSVELDSIEEAAGRSVPVQEKKYPTWIGALALIVIVLLAACMALSATHWSATLDFLKGTFRISGGRGRDEATGG
jgi:hypothetical protein